MHIWSIKKVGENGNVLIRESVKGEHDLAISRDMTVNWKECEMTLEVTCFKSWFTSNFCF